jgi:hypothetical protein
MQYLLLAITDETGFLKMDKPSQEQAVASFVAYVQSLNAAGVLVGSYRPMPSPNSQIVRVSGGKPEVVGGPYSSAKEQLTGIYVIDVPDIDVAVSWAERNPAASLGVVEVRPVAASRA